MEVKTLEDNKKIISFSVDDIQIQSLDDVNDSQFAKARLKCFASGKTAHKYSFTEEVLKDEELTILYKPLLWNYDVFTDDAKGHEKSEIPCGFVPKADANISYEKADDGRLFLCVDVWIWKLYCGKLMEIFQRTDGHKHVSVELWILDSIEHPEEDYTEVTKFCYTGITILGESVNPAVKDADIQIVKFSEAKQEFEDLLNSIDGNQEDNGNKEVTMAKEVIENSAETTPEVVENAEKIVRTSVSVSQDTDTYTDEGQYVGNEYESHYKSTTTIEHVPDGEQNSEPEQLNNEKEECQENVTNEMPMEEKCSQLELKCSDLETKLTTLQNQHSALELKCAELEEYRNNKENELKHRLFV
jgi:hypothetical protein